MKKIFFYILIATVIASCTGSQSKTTQTDTTDQSNSTDTAISYKIAERYFIKNDVTTLPVSLKNQEEFDKYFGVASVMGENGAPTKIDFSKEYVIVVAHDTTSKKIEIKPQEMIQQGTDIILDYTETEGESLSYTQRPFLMLIVDKKHEGDIVLRKK